MYKLNLEEIDPSGAIAEAHAGIEGDSRMDFLKKAGLGGVAAVSGGTLVAALAAGPAAAAPTKIPRPPAAFGKGDIGILNYALTLEFLEAAFYTEALASGAITDPMVMTFLKVVESDERKHVAALKKAIPASKRAKKPKFDFMGTNKDQEMFKTTSQALENTGVGAYFGQGFNIKNPDILKVAVSILTIEARHAGAIGLINGGSQIAPNGPFDKPKTPAAVLKAAGPFIVK